MTTHRLTGHANARWSLWSLISILFLAITVVGCTSISPKPEQLQLPTAPPEVRETSFSATLAQLGMQSEIYGAKLLKIQCREVEDDTGTSYHSGGEIPKNITVMVNSALNAIGGKVIYIPYWPNYFASMQVSGYSVGQQKLVPEVILSGGITEFDRGLTTLEKTRNLDFETKDIGGAPDWFDNKSIGLDYSQGEKWSQAKIAIDFNLISFDAQCGIPKMQTSNGVTVFKGIKEGELGFSLFGPTIGLRGSVKKVQGRHDAVRLLVQFSVIQLVGRYLDLPYWQLFDEAKSDSVVMESVQNAYLRKDPSSRVFWLKRLLWSHGYPVNINAELDTKTKAAIAKLDPNYDDQNASVPVDTFLNIYLSVPLNDKSLKAAREFDRLYSQMQALEQQQKIKDGQEQEPSESEKQTFEKPIEPTSKDRSKTVDPKAAESKAAEPPQTPPKPDVIIITPLDSDTHDSLRRILWRIKDNRQRQVNVQGIP